MPAPKTHTLYLLGALLLPAAGARARELSLAEALTLGLRRAPTLQESRALRRAALSRIDERLSAYMPTAGAAIAGAAELAQPTETALRERAVSARVSLELQWTLYDFGRTAHGLASAEADAAASKAAVQSAALQAQATVASAYVSAYYSRELRRELERTIEQRQHLLAIASGLVKSGLQPPLEGLRAQSRVTSAQLQLAVLEADERSAHATLSLLLGLSPEKPLELRGPRLVAAPAGMAAATALPSVQRSRMQARSAHALALASRAEYLPTFGLSLASGATRIGPRPSATLWDLSAQLVVSVPVLDLSIGARARAAEAEAAAAHSQLGEALRQARIEIAQAQLALRGAEQAAIVASEAAEQAQAVLQVVKARYVKGLSSPIELIEAESADTEARLQRVQTRWDLALTRIRLLTARGRPLKELGP